jgi:hypothetical protein
LISAFYLDCGDWLKRKKRLAQNTGNVGQRGLLRRNDWKLYARVQHFKSFRVKARVYCDSYTQTVLHYARKLVVRIPVARLLITGTPPWETTVNPPTAQVVNGCVGIAVAKLRTTAGTDVEINRRIIHRIPTNWAQIFTRTRSYTHIFVGRKPTVLTVGGIVVHRYYVLAFQVFTGYHRRVPGK